MTGPLSDVFVLMMLGSYIGKCGADYVIASTEHEEESRRHYKYMFAYGMTVIGVALFLVVRVVVEAVHLVGML